jgi:hypothetical protein
VTDGALHFVDPDALSNARFYRVEPQPALPPDDQPSRGPKRRGTVGPRPFGGKASNIGI